MRQFLARLIGKPIIVLLVVIILIMVIVQLILSNQLAISTGKLSQVLTEIANYERENRDLSVQISQKGSILRLRELATKFGFAEPKKFFFIKQNFLVAENR